MCERARNRPVGQDRLGREGGADRKAISVVDYYGRAHPNACQRHGAISLLLSRCEIGFWIDVPSALEAAARASERASDLVPEKKYVFRLINSRCAY